MTNQIFSSIEQFSPRGFSGGHMIAARTAEQLSLTLRMKLTRKESTGWEFSEFYSRIERRGSLHTISDNDDDDATIMMTLKECCEYLFNIRNLLNDKAHFLAHRMTSKKKIKFSHSLNFSIFVIYDNATSLSRSNQMCHCVVRARSSTKIIQLKNNKIFTLCRSILRKMVAMKKNWMKKCHDWFMI